MPEQSPQTYRTLNQSWARPEQAVHIKGGDGVVIADIPLSFLEASNSNTWDYILYVIHLSVEQRGYVVSDDGQRLQGQAVPMAGRYSFVSRAFISRAKGRVHGLIFAGLTRAADPIQVVFRSGPEGKSKRKAPTGTSVSTWSNSARSSTNQVNAQHSSVATILM